jgi:hypothetical protein
MLAERRGRWLGDDLAAIALLASLIDEAERQLAERVDTPYGNAHCWDNIAQALGTTSVEVRMRFDGRSPVARAWLHGISANGAAQL